MADKGKPIDNQISETTQSNAADHQDTPKTELIIESNEARAEEILSRLQTGDKEEVVILTGEAGTGKTWLAQKVTKSAVGVSFFMSIWISLNHDKESVHQSIARQLSIPTLADVWEDDDDNDTGITKDYADTESWENMTTMVEQKLDKKKQEMLSERSEQKHTFLLLVLDSDERPGHVENGATYKHYKDIMVLFDRLRKQLSSDDMKVLLTTRKIEQGSAPERSFEFKVEPLSGTHAKLLLQDLGKDVSLFQKFNQFTGEIEKRSKVLPAQIVMLAQVFNQIPINYSEVLQRAVDAALKTEQGSGEVQEKLLSGDKAEMFLKEHARDEVSESQKFKEIFDAIKKASQVSPTQIVVLEEALNRIRRDCLEELERAFDEAINILQNAEGDDPIPLLLFAYEKLPGDCMIDCFWHSFKFLGKYGSVHYNELITHWMLEGHLDLAVGLKEAYNNGYDVMMRLIDRGMLKMQGGNLVGLEAATLRNYKQQLTLEDVSNRGRGLFDTSKLGLGSVLEGESSKVFRRMAPADGMMKTVSVAGEPVPSLLIDGSRLCREVPETFFQSVKEKDAQVVDQKKEAQVVDQKKEPQVRALFQHRLTSLPESICEMKSLLVLVLRDCSLLNDVQRIGNLKNLIVLEISGSPFVKEIPDVVFKDKSKLRSLHLSALGIESLPQTFSDLTELRRLIIRQCSSLEALPKLGKLKQLEVIDLSGCSSLKKIQEKSFKFLTNLQALNLSGTKIEKLPIVQTLPKLKVLLFKGCDCLSGMRLMKKLDSLKVLDASGATRIKEIFYDCFDETDNLRILDLSKTEIRFLPDSLGKHLCDLRLKDCPKLEKLTSTKDLTDLESLDLSNASSLKNFEEDFFENLKNLQFLNLSNSPATSLPSLSNLKKLRQLFLKHCLFQTLPELSELTSLVVLDLSNCENLDTLPSLTKNKHLEIINLSSCRNLSKLDDSFGHMSQLQELNISETKITRLPDLPGKLRSLVLTNCTELKNPPNFENLTQLEQLDLRGTTSLEPIKADSLKQLKQLHTLRLSKNALDQGVQLTGLTTLHVLDLSGEAVESLSPDLDGLSNLQQLLLRGCSSLKALPSLKSLGHLEVLDLSGTKVENVRDKILELTQLKRLHLPEKSIEEFKQQNAGNANFPPLELKFDRCCISEASEIPQEGEKPSAVVLMHSTELFKSLKEDPKLLESIRQSIWTISSVHSSKTQGKCEDNYGDSRKHIFRDVYSKIKQPRLPEGQIVEIQGFDDSPNHIEVVLEHASHIILVENQFLKNLSDLNPSSLKNMKGCWLERCTNVESIFDKAGHEMGENLEILWISNLPNLKILCPSGSFRNLKDVYIDCCPTLETVFSSAQLPPTLETLQIMFCDKLKTVFGAEDSATSELQARGSTGKEVQPTTTSSANRDSALREAQTKASAAHKEMEKKQNTTSADKKAQTTSSEEKKVQVASSENKEAPAPTAADKKVQAASSEKKVQAVSSEDKGTQTLTEVDKKVQAESSENKEAQTPTSVSKEAQTPSSEIKEAQPATKLKYLHISYCPMLETIFSSAQPPPKTLEVLQIKFCGKLKSLSDSGQELNQSELPKLKTLHLTELPSWTGPRIEHGFNQTIIKNVKGCPNKPPKPIGTET